MTRSGMWRTVRIAVAAILSPLLVFPASPPVQSHVVSPAELQRELLSATRLRHQHQASISRFLASPQAEKALSAAGVDRAQVTTAMSALSDKELARLAARAENAQAEFAAGRLTERDLLIILIGIAALILIIVAVR